MRRVLFLCTGNYYRSRFAEHLFNALAQQEGLDWRAESRGLAIERGVGNVGPISPAALRGLAERGVPVPAGERFPRQAQACDFASADRVVALNEAEHRALVAGRFPQWAGAVEYWQVGDLGEMTAGKGLAQIEERVRELLRALEKVGKIG